MPDTHKIHHMRDIPLYEASQKIGWHSKTMGISALSLGMDASMADERGKHDQSYEEWEYCPDDDTEYDSEREDSSEQDYVSEKECNSKKEQGAQEPEHDRAEEQEYSSREDQGYGSGEDQESFFRLGENLETERRVEGNSSVDIEV